MKRFLVLIALTVFLLAAFLPSAFCVADEAVVARFGTLLERLDAAANYLDGQVVQDIEEAEALADNADVQAAYSAEDLAKVPAYRLRYEKEVALEDLFVCVKLDRYVRIDREERTFAYGEWQRIATLYDEVKDTIGAATAKQDVWSAKQGFYDAVAALPQYDEVYDAYTTRFEAAVQPHADALYQKVNAYRVAEGYVAKEGPIFRLADYYGFVDSFEAYVDANLADGTLVKKTMNDAMAALVEMGLYATEQQMSTVWADYDEAIRAATVAITPDEAILVAAVNQAVATFTQAIADSQYIQSLSGTDYAMYQALPNVLREDLQSAQSVEEVNAMLADYMQLLQPGSYERPQNKLNTLVILIIVMGSVSVVLFAAYFIMRARAKANQPAKQDAAVLLSELQAMANEAKAKEEASQVAAESEEVADAPTAEEPSAEQQESPATTQHEGTEEDDA